MIGTKTALYGGFIVLIPIIIYAIFKKLHPQYFLLLVLCGALFIYIPTTSGATNKQIEQAPAEVEEEKHTLLSSCDVYLRDTSTDFQVEPKKQKLIGHSYRGNYTKETKKIMMVFCDLFFSIGIVATVVMLLAGLALVY